MLDKRVKKRIQEAGGVFKDRDIREITEAAVPIENQSGGERAISAMSGRL